MGVRVADMSQRGSGQSLAVSRMQVDDLTNVLEALTEAFGDGFDPGWFHWKHETSPWGRSEAWVARDDRGLLGVRMLLPWQFRSDPGTLRAYRPCDTVTVPRARGRGVFSRLTREAIANLEGEGAFVFNTPNEQSKPGYLKMGFVEWARVRQWLGTVRPKKSKLGQPIPPADSTCDATSTAITNDFLIWRYQSCPKYRYELRGVDGAADSNGIVWRARRWRGVKLMVIAELWGPSRLRKILVRAAASELGTSKVWCSESARESVDWSIPVGSTVVTRYDLKASNPREPVFSVGDVEDVI